MDNLLFINYTSSKKKKTLKSLNHRCPSISLHCLQEEIQIFLQSTDLNCNYFIVWLLIILPLDCKLHKVRTMTTLFTTVIPTSSTVPGKREDVQSVYIFECVLALSYSNSKTSELPPPASPQRFLETS